jgi:hypothetical protein
MDWSKFSSSATAEDMAGNTTVKSKCKGSRKRKNEKSSPSRLYPDEKQSREREKDPGYCVFVTRRTISQYEKKKDMFNRVSLAILHYRLHERIHCRPENSRLQLEYSLAIFFCPGRLPGAEYESTGSTGDVQPRASFAVRSREKKTRSGFTDSKRIQ